MNFKDWLLVLKNQVSWFSRIKSETAFPRIRNNKLVYSWMITCPWSAQMTVFCICLLVKKTSCLLKLVVVLLSTPRMFKLFYYHNYHCHQKKKTQVTEWFFCTCCNLVLKSDHIMQSTCWPSSPVFNKAIVTFLGVSWKSLQGFITLEFKCHIDKSLFTFFASLAIRSIIVCQPRSQHWTLKVCGAMSYLWKLECNVSDKL